MIALTSQAIDKIKSVIKSQKNILGIKVSMKPNGFAGLSYSIDYVTGRDNWTDEWRVSGISIFTELRDSEYLENLTVDYINDGFVFID